MSNESIVVPQAARRALPRRINAGKLTGQKPALEAARRLKCAPMTVHRMISTSRLRAKQVCRGAPWVLKAEDVVEFGSTNGRKAPQPADARQTSLDFQ